LRNLNLVADGKMNIIVSITNYLQRLVDFHDYFSLLPRMTFLTSEDEGGASWLQDVPSPPRVFAPIEIRFDPNKSRQPYSGAMKICRITIRRISGSSKFAIRQIFGLSNLHF